MRNEVPKCKKCWHFRLYPISIGQRDHYWCSKVQVMGIDKSIDSKDTRTSPKWCPNRIKI
jgi:hypothetical protein